MEIIGYCTVSSNKHCIFFDSQVGITSLIVELYHGVSLNNIIAIKKQKNPKKKNNE